MKIFVQCLPSWLLPSGPWIRRRTRSCWSRFVVYLYGWFSTLGGVYGSMVGPIRANKHPTPLKIHNLSYSSHCQTSTCSLLDSSLFLYTRFSTTNKKSPSWFDIHVSSHPHPFSTTIPRGFFSRCCRKSCQIVQSSRFVPTRSLQEHARNGTRSPTYATATCHTLPEERRRQERDRPVQTLQRRRGPQGASESVQSLSRPLAEEVSRDSSRFAQERRIERRCQRSRR